MNIEQIRGILGGFRKPPAEEVPIPAPPLAPVDVKELEAMAASATRVAYHLCYPVQFKYRTNVSNDYALLILREILHLPGDYLFRCIVKDGGQPRLFAMSRMSEFTSGHTGAPVDSMEAFIERFRIFDDTDYFDIRIALNLLLYLARADGRYTPEERAVLSAFTDRFCAKRGEDSAKIKDYLQNAYVTQYTFLEALRELDRLPPEDIRDLIDTARVLIEADHSISPEEHDFFSRLDLAMRSRA
ncbi:MAG: TerB family tellurite resistance protein [Alphaproteobacteria bacterium]|nr:TerB family tellurite resistance protein [Alphaproteobacteria bacterium]